MRKENMPISVARSCIMSSRTRTTTLLFLLLFFLFTTAATPSFSSAAPNLKNVTAATTTEQEPPEAADLVLENAVSDFDSLENDEGGANPEDDGTYLHMLDDDEEDEEGENSSLLSVITLLALNALLDDVELFSWPQLVRAITAAKCATMDMASLKAQAPHSLCTRPVVLLSVSEHDCSSCESLLKELLIDRRAEFDFARGYVTLVRMSEFPITEIERIPYPLPVPGIFASLKAAREEVGVVEQQQRQDNHKDTSDGTVSEEDWLMEKQSQDPLLFHRSQRLTRSMRVAFEGEGSYVARALFLYPHNGSIMQDVVNIDPDRIGSNEIHFYYTAKSLFWSMHRAVAVMREVLDSG